MSKTRVEKLVGWWWRLSDETRMAYSMLVMLVVTVIVLFTASFFSRFSCY